MTNENHVVWLRLVDAGTDSECWFVCNRCDPGAIPFIAESEITRPAEVGGVERDAARFRALESWFDGLKSYQARIVFDYMGLTHADECNAGFGDATDALIENQSNPGSEAKS